MAVRRFIKRLTLLGAGAALLGALVWRAGPADIWMHVSRVGWGFGWLLLLTLGWQTVGALAWRTLFDRHHPSIGWKTIWYTRVCGEAVNTLTPFLNMGGEPVKIWLINRKLEGEEGASYVILDKTIYFFASLLYMATGLAVGLVLLTGHGLLLAASAGLLGIWIGGLLYLVRRQSGGDTLVGLLDLAERFRIKVSPKLREQMNRADKAMAAFWHEHRARFVAALVLHFVGRLLRALDVWVIGYLIGMPMSPAAAYFISAAAVLVNAAFAFIPGALGAYEGSHGYLMKLLGLGLDGGISMGILRRVRTLAFAGLSYLLLILAPNSEKPAAAHPTEPNHAGPSTLLAVLLAALLLGATALRAQPADEESGEDETAVEEVDAEAGTSAVQLTLEEAIARALDQSVELDMVRAGLAVSQTQLTQAKRARWATKFDLVNVSGVINEARGDATFSPNEDTDFLSGLGPFTRVEIDLVQPIYTFGKLDAAIELATQGIEIAEQGLRSKTEEIRKRVSLLYWGLQVVGDMKGILSDARKHLDEHYEKVKENVEAETGNYTNVDLYKVELFRSQLAAGEEELLKRERLARRTMALLLGLQPNEVFRPKARHLQTPKTELRTLEFYQDSALLNRPEARQLRAGLRARRAQVDMARANMMPDIFLGAKFTYAVAPNRDDVTNPFASDNFNVVGGGPFLGLRWDLALHRRHAELQTAKAELLATEAKARAAEFGFTLRVEEAYAEAIRAKNSYEQLNRALKSAKKWFRSTVLNVSIGVVGTEEVISAFKAYLEQRKSYFEALFDYNQAIAELNFQAALLPSPQEPTK